MSKVLQHVYGADPSCLCDKLNELGVQSSDVHSIHSFGSGKRAVAYYYGEKPVEKKRGMTANEIEQVNNGIVPPYWEDDPKIVEAAAKAAEARMMLAPKDQAAYDDALGEVEPDVIPAAEVYYKPPGKTKKPAPSKAKKPKGKK